MSFISSIQNRFQNRKIVGLGLSDDQQPVGVCVVNDQGELSIVQELSGEEEIHDYLRQHPFTCVTVCIHSRQVVHTIAAEKITQENVADIFQENVPNGKPDDFIIDFSDHLLTFARRASVESALAPFSDFQDQIIGVYLSPTSGLPLAGFLREKGETDQVVVDRFRYFFQHDRLQSVEPAVSEWLTAGTQKVESQQVLPFVSVVTFLSRGNRQTQYTGIAERYEELFYKMIYSRAKLPALSFLLIVFLLNTALFFLFDQKNRQLKEKSSYVQQLDRKLKTIHAFISENEKLVTPSEVKFSMVCDQVGYHTPKGITLKRLTINPPSERTRSAAFVEGRMIIEGEASDARVFSKWLSKLNELEWLSNVEKQTYESIIAGEERSSFQLIIQCHVEKLKL